MRKSLFAFAALGLTALGAQAATAQDTPSTSNTSFRGFRLEGNVGGDRFQSQGRHNDKLGYGGTAGFDGTIGNKIVVGPEASYWRANDWNQICKGSGAQATTCQKSFEEWGVGARAGYLVTPAFLVYGKGGYVMNEQRKQAVLPTGALSYYDHYRSDGYQVGGGLEYTLTNVESHVPLFVGAQYVFSQYHDHTSRQRLMGTVGVRFK